ncbi:MAG: DUF1579 domain-containing protein [Acidobacteria bacterium]|jgi:hypothetical protein|nr:DUF1579 domain-containing protein [Acidobacteriota bacterium]
MLTKKVCFVFLVLIMVGTCFSQGEKQMTPEQQKAMEAYAKMGALNENHEFLKKFVGEWNATSKAWMMPGQEPVSSEGKAEAELILNGRFLKWRFHGTMFGEPFEGMQVVGYDNLKQKYVTLWIDSSSTAFFLLEGTRQGNTITDSGIWPDPATGKDEKVKSVMTVVGPDELNYELFMVGNDGKEFKSMEIRYLRKK